MVAKKRARREVAVEEDPSPDKEIKPGRSMDIYNVHDAHPEVFPSGCCLLDQVLGGGWAYSRIANIVGVQSSGKTQLAIEAAVNFLVDNPNGTVVYCEAEAAFDLDYAESLGMPIDQIDFPDLITVEDVFEDLEKRFDSPNRTLYIIDSLDALSDRDEQERKIDAGSYAMTKQKKLSEMFRRIVKRLKKSQVTMLVISQVREAIGVTYGDKLKRSGGRALDFYASQVLWLKHIKKIEPQRSGHKRTIGVLVEALCKKNKVGRPFRRAQFPIIFHFGIEELQACLDWLIEEKRTDTLGMTQQDAVKLSKKVWQLDDAQYESDLANAKDAVREVWAEIEKEFDPGRRKYKVIL